VKAVIQDDSEAVSHPSGLGARSYSNPRERAAQMDLQAHKRLSLPNNGLLQLEDSIMHLCCFCFSFCIVFLDLSGVYSMERCCSQF
jgi:hypothetical protein